MLIVNLVIGVNGGRVIDPVELMITQVNKPEQGQLLHFKSVMELLVLVDSMWGIAKQALKTVRV